MAVVSPSDKTVIQSKVKRKFKTHSQESNRKVFLKVRKKFLKKLKKVFRMAKIVSKELKKSFF